MAAHREARSAEAPLIVRDPDILGGEPIVRGTRIPVRSIVLAAQEYGGESGAQSAYPHVSVGAIAAALAYYHRHRDEIEQYIRENISDL